MLATFATLSPHLSKLQSRNISIDNLCFKFHYRGTFIIFIVCTVLVTSRQYIGEHIRCITGGSIPEHVINTFCFFTTTFTVIRHLNESMLQSGTIPHPGVGPMYEEDPVKYHGYYQWVPFVLFLQGIMFYLTHGFWRKWEGGKIKLLVNGLQMVALSKHFCKDQDIEINKNSRLLCKTTVDGRIKKIRTVFLQHIFVNRYWAWRLVICEIINFFHVILQIFITNRFLRGQFLRLGIDFIQDDFTGTMDTLDIVFPKVTKCNFYKYGPSGSIQKHDALCVMALNVINEKVYTFLWFWFIILLFVSLIAIIWRMITLCFYKNSKFNGFVFSMACPGRLSPTDMSTVVSKFRFSDWIFMYYLAKNMEAYMFRDLLTQLANETKTHKVEFKEEKILIMNEKRNNDDDDSISEDDQNRMNLDTVDYLQIKEKRT